MKKCANCNYKCYDNDIYCRNCGIKINNNFYYIFLEVIKYILFIILIFAILLIIASYFVS